MRILHKEGYLDKTQKEFILTNLDDDGRLSCLKAFKVAILIGMKPIKMPKVCESIGIKIRSCKFGVFEKIKFQNTENAIYNKIRKNFTQDKNISCRALLYIALESSLRSVGFVLKNSDYEGKYCSQGCFYERKAYCEIKN